MDDEKLETAEPETTELETAEPVEVADGEIDAVTGASPGTAQACNDLGLNSLDANLERFGIKPPGES